jgi:HisJ family histidinol phosphate phosphatase
MIQDLHLHTKFSDGVNSIEEMVLKAISLNINAIGFSDHVWKISAWTNDYLFEISQMQKKYSSKIKIFPGFETKLINHNGELDINESLYGQGVRIVAAIHRIPLGNGEYIRGSQIGDNIELSKKIWLISFKSLINNKRINAIAHPFSLFSQMNIKKYDDKWWETISHIIDLMPFKIEYNVKYDNDMVPEWIWKKHIHKLVLGSDSHSTDEIEYRLPKLIRITQALKLPYNEVT